MSIIFQRSNIFSAAELKDNWHVSLLALRTIYFFVSICGLFLDSCGLEDASLLPVCCCLWPRKEAWDFELFCIADITAWQIASIWLPLGAEFDLVGHAIQKVSIICQSVIMLITVVKMRTMQQSFSAIIYSWWVISFLIFQQNNSINSSVEGLRHQRPRPVWTRDQ